MTQKVGRSVHTNHACSFWEKLKTVRLRGFPKASFPSHAADGKKQHFFHQFFGTRRFGWFHGFMASCVNWLMANPIATLGSIARSKKNNNQKVADRPRNPWYQTLTAFHICKLHFSLSMSWLQNVTSEVPRAGKNNLIYSLRQVCWSLYCVLCCSLPSPKYQRWSFTTSICAVSTPRNLDTSVGFYHMFACTKWSTLS